MTPEQLLQMHTEFGYRMCFDDIMEVLEDLRKEDKCNIHDFWERMQNQFEIRKVDGFTLSEELARIVNAK